MALFSLLALLLLVNPGIHPACGAGWENTCQLALESPHTNQQIAEDSGLHYIVPGGAGISRAAMRGKPGFAYFGAKGAPITDPATLQRIRDLGIPPGYKDVWISADPDAHIQAIALDSKGREQYRYHPRWIAAKAHEKFARMIRFGNALDSIHQAESSDLGLPGLPRDKMLAALTRLLESSSIRVGNAKYALQNESFGLTTLLSDQVRVEGSTIHFSFKGKSGVFHDFDLEDRELARITTKSLALHQKQAFEYLDEEGVPRTIDSSLLNDYLKRISGGSFSAKDFRTWGGTTFAAKALIEAPLPKTPEQAQAHITRAVEYAASRLGNTPTVCRSNYIDPRLLEAYLNGDFQAALEKVHGEPTHDTLKTEERLVLRLLSR